MHSVLCFIIIFIVSSDWSCLSVLVDTDIFDDNGCFEGILEVNEDGESHSIHIKGIKNSKEVVKSEFLLKNSGDGLLHSGRPAESPVSFINRMAAFNKVPVEYHIVKEEGPDHDKRFTISLILGEETYMGEGKSIKSAKQVAASEAIEKTSYNVPPVKQKKYLKQNFSLSDIDTDLDPVSLVYELSKKLNLPVNFELFDENGPSHEKIFIMRCVVGNIIKSGEGPTKKKAKRMAAIKALEELQKIFQSNDENSTEQMQKSRRRKKNKKNKNKMRRLVKAVKNKSTWRDAFSLMWQSLRDWDTSFGVVDYRQKNIATKEDWFIDYQKKHAVQQKNIVKDPHSQPSENIVEVQEFDTLQEDNKADRHSDVYEDTFNDDDEELKGHPDSGRFIIFDHDAGKQHNEINPHLFGTKESDVIKISNKNKLGDGVQTPKDVLAHVLHSVGYKLQFYEFLKTNSTQIVSIVQLPLKPPIVCYGVATTTSDAQNKAAKSSLNEIKIQTGFDKMKEETL